MKEVMNRTGIPTDAQIEHHGNSVIVRFPGPRNVLSTSWLNGGCRTDLVAVFNHQISLAACEACHNGGKIRSYLEGVATDLGFDPAGVTGLVTRAEMKNTAVVSETFRDLTVTAMVTAGIDKNGGRAGDPASYYENGETFEPVGGTINTILIIGADLPEYAMSRALITATEAKAAALQQLMARSIYSSGIATGSGTDMIAVVADPGSPLHLSDAGKHAKLGEMIGRSVMRATIAALEMETGLSRSSQHDALVRLSRFGVTAEQLWDAVLDTRLPSDAGREEKVQFVSYVKTRAVDPDLLVPIAAAIHIIDESEWGLIPRTAACRMIARLYSEHECHKSASPDENPLQVLVREFAGFLYREYYDVVSTKELPNTSA